MIGLLIFHQIQITSQTLRRGNSKVTSLYLSCSFLLFCASFRLEFLLFFHPHSEEDIRKLESISEGVSYEDFGSDSLDI